MWFGDESHLGVEVLAEVGEVAETLAASVTQFARYRRRVIGAPRAKPCRSWRRSPELRRSPRTTAENPRRPPGWLRCPEARFRTRGPSGAASLRPRSGRKRPVSPGTRKRTSVERSLLGRSSVTIREGSDLGAAEPAGWAAEDRISAPRKADPAAGTTSGRPEGRVTSPMQSPAFREELNSRDRRGGNESGSPASDRTPPGRSRCSP
jgi:hypothetical protein